MSATSTAAVGERRDRPPAPGDWAVRASDVVPAASRWRPEAAHAAAHAAAHTPDTGAAPATLPAAAATAPNGRPGGAPAGGRVDVGAGVGAEAAPEPHAAPRPRGRLTWRLARLVAASVAAVLAATLLLLDAAARDSAAAASAAGLERTTRLVGVLLAGRERALARAADVFAQNPRFRALLAEGRPADLHDQAAEAAERTGASWVQLVDARGVRLARSDDPAAPLVGLGGSALVQGALGGAVTRGAGAVGDTVLFQAVAVPVQVPVAGAGRGAGALMAAQRVDAVLAREAARLSASEVIFFVFDTSGAPRAVASSLDGPVAEVLVGARGSAALFADAVRPVLAAAPWGRAPNAAGRSGAGTAALTLGGVSYVGRAAPLRSAGGEVLGGFVALRAWDAERAPFAALRRRLAAAGLVGLVLGVALSLRTARLVARPVLALAAAARRAAAGDYAARDLDALPPGADEIGALGDAMRAMLADLRAKAALVAALRGGTPTGGTAAAANTEPLGAAAAAPAAPAPGAVLAGRYTLRRQLGAGAAGVVFEAFDGELGEVVAVKALRPEALAGDPAAVDRLKAEIRLARRITHRNVVRTHDLGAAGGTHFITMEYVAGTTLHALLERDGRLAAPAVLALGEQLFRALEVAHAAGVVHRDVKPQNLMVGPDGTLKVTDFGIARLDAAPNGLTQAGMVVGTPVYMAPEQLMGEPVDGRADLYACGVVLYQCLTGRLPYPGGPPAALAARALAARPEPPHALAPGVPAALSAAVLALLAPEPAHRPPSAAAARAMLARAAA